MVCAHFSELRKATLVAEQTADLTPEKIHVMARTCLGSQAFIQALVEEDERFANIPLSSEYKRTPMDLEFVTNKIKGRIHPVVTASSTSVSHTIREEGKSQNVNPCIPTLSPLSSLCTN